MLFFLGRNFSAFLHLSRFERKNNFKLEAKISLVKVSLHLSRKRSTLLNFQEQVVFESKLIDNSFVTAIK